MITKEMIDHFQERTKTHIAYVASWYDKLSKKYGSGSPLKEHDVEKFSDKQYEPYIYLTWFYRCKRLKIPYEYPEGVQAQVDNAIYLHKTGSLHHPEFWGGTQLGVITNAHLMPPQSIMEMASDWMAMSQEKGGNPTDWAKENIGKRWIFTEKQEETIYKYLSIYDL